ncbi:DUF1697 domain-containing protein [Nocardiopsis sp. MG754419]|uniref:DUF1697 domain-containing protein n=1 Tax=Nocardiopsis sp. MG754419 TaxID=2259865 RepID=UPI00201191B5|nr:DUF1697 domain-containing protein [Nocardiopsis sp. MG754419]
MTRLIVLLRGINVGGHRKVGMADLRALLSGLGYTDVATYVQSGNAVLTAPEGMAAAPEDAAARIRTAIAEAWGLDVGIVVRTVERWRATVADNPLEVPDPARFLVLFAADPIDPDVLADVDPADRPDEVVALGPDVAYTRHRDGLRYAKYPDLLARRLPGVTTGRNWRTVLRLLEMAEDG